MSDNHSLHFGTKVRPIFKSAGITSLDDSFCWEKAKKISQDFLFVVGYEEGENCWILNHGLNLSGGDYFNSEDFEILEYPYLEDE